MSGVTATRTPSTVQSLARGLRTLRLFTRERPALTLGDCAARLELSAPTTYRLLNTLEAERFLERDVATGAYRLAPGVLELVPALLDGLAVPRLAQPLVAGLARQTGESANLAALEEGRVLYLVSASRTGCCGPTLHRACGSTPTAPLWGRASSPSCPTTRHGDSWERSPTEP
jgi:DNA-binding IclR family transcriptional regulator